MVNQRIASSLLVLLAGLAACSRDDDKKKESADDAAAAVADDPDAPVDDATVVAINESVATTGASVSVISPRKEPSLGSAKPTTANGTVVETPVIVAESNAIVAQYNLDGSTIAMLKEGLKVAQNCTIAKGETSIAQVVNLAGDTAKIKVPCKGQMIELSVKLGDLIAIQSLDVGKLARLDAETKVAVAKELEDHKRDLAAGVYRIAGVSLADDPYVNDATTNTVTTNTVTTESGMCEPRFEFSRDGHNFVPFPLNKCSVKQEPRTDAARKALAESARVKGQQIYDDRLRQYYAAQAQIAQLNAAQANVNQLYSLGMYHIATQGRSRWDYIKDNYFGHDDKRDDYARDLTLAYQAQTQAIQAQIQVLAQIQPYSADTSRSLANKVIYKDICVLNRSIVEKGGKHGAHPVGVTIESSNAPELDIKFAFDQSPFMPQTDWGGVFKAVTQSNESTDVTRIPLAKMVPAAAKVGPLQLYIKIQRLSAKGAPVGEFCSLVAGMR